MSTAGWGTGWNPAVAASAALRRPPPKAFRYATGAERFAGLFLDALILSAINAVLNVVGNIGGIALGNAVQSCETVPTFRGDLVRCTGSTGAYVTVVVVFAMVGMIVWWKLVPSRMSNRGATIGMAAMGVRIVTVEDHKSVSTGQAFLRSVVAGVLPLVVWAPAGFAILAAGSLSVRDIEGADDVVEAFGPLWPWATAMVFAYLLGMLPMLWHFIDRRYQTLYDKVAGTVVISSR